MKTSCSRILLHIRKESKATKTLMKHGTDETVSPPVTDLSHLPVHSTRRSAHYQESKISRESWIRKGGREKRNE